MIWAGTERGLFRIGDGAEPEPVVPDRRIVDLAAGPDGDWLALVDGDSLLAADGLTVTLAGPAATCLLGHHGWALVGTREAHLVHVKGGVVQPVSSFDQAEGRDTWYTPWGGPPDTRSISSGPDGAIYVNVHVGGILRSDDHGATWVPTIDVDADVHQVLTDGPRLVAATAYGLAQSEDRGQTWAFETEGLHATYARAVAVATDWLLLSASTGPGGEQAAVYRRRLEGGPGTAFERCRDGLPEWFSGNVDTRCLAARGETVVVGTAEGSVFRSDDAGAGWRLVADGLPRITALALATPAG